ncbi:MAG: peptidyl-prolyl cis-trans isomerase [Thiomicrorhabdus sp.]|nr:peptidyl-prolyl cis-trans isomerase [Thiomicrorhabdus sp.]
MKQYKWLLTTCLLITSTTLSMQTLASSTSLNAATSTTPSQEIARELLARVNGQPIYQDQLEAQVQAKLKKYKRFSAKGPTSLSEDLKKGLQNEVLQKYIHAELIHQASKTHKVKNIDEKITLFIENAKKNNIPIQNKEAIKRQIHINEYLQAHDLIDTLPSDEEVRAFYEKGKDKFISSQEKRRVQHVFTVENDNIVKAQKLLSDGQSFKDVAIKYSKDENSNENGDLGFITKGYMPKEVEDFVFSTQPNKLSPIIKTDSGYHLVKVLEIRAKGRTVPYEKIKDFLAQGLKTQTKSKKVGEHITRLKENAKIEFFTSK